MDQLAKAPKVKSISSQNTLETLRIGKETKRKIQNVLTAINKKELGKKVKAGDLLDVAIGLITKEHIIKLQEESFTNKDRLEMQFREYHARNSKISKDEFLGMVLSGRMASINVSKPVIPSGINNEDLI